MFVRTQTNGQRTYLLIVANQRVNGQVQQKVLHRLGRLDKLPAIGGLDALLQSLGRFSEKCTVLGAHAKGEGLTTVMPQSRGPWDELQLVSGGIRKGSGQAESLSHPGAQAVAPETEALLTTPSAPNCGRVTRRKISESLETFRRLRAENYDLLKDLPEAVFERTGTHSERGPVTLRQLVELNAEHPEKHARQVQEIRRQYKQFRAGT